MAATIHNLAHLATRTTRVMRSGRAPVLLTLVLFGCLAGNATPQEIDRQYDIKAAFLYKFTLYVQWPDEAFAGPKSPFDIAVVGGDRFGTTLDRIAAAKKVADHPMKIARFKSVADLAAKAGKSPPHMLFVSKDLPAKDQKAVIAAFAKQPTLLVGESEGFCAMGGTVNLLVQNNETQVEINISAAQGNRLSPAASLINIAKKVSTQSEAQKP